MAFSINKAILLGNVTRDPELHTTKTGRFILTINMATNHSYKQPDGSFTDVATFHRVIVFGNFANWLSKNIHKGMKIYVDGRISTREYTDKQGQKQRSREIIAENVVPMSEQAVKNIKNPTVTPGQAATQTAKTDGDTVEQEPPQEPGKNDENISPDDIPF